MIELIIIGDILVSAFIIVLACILFLSYKNEDFDKVSQIPLKDD